MSEGNESTYYTSQEDRLLRQFDRVGKRFSRSLARRRDEAYAAAVVADARTEFERLIPELPYVGGRDNIYTPVVVVNGWIIALLRSMKARGKTAEDVVRICAEVADEFFRSFPAFLLALLGRAAFSGLVRRTLTKQAARSQAREFPGDWVYTFGPGENGEWVLEFSECGVTKLYQAQGVEDLAPYCNFFDVTYSRLLNMGLDSTETLGLGCEACRLRFKPGRETVIPQRLSGVIPRT